MFVINKFFITFEVFKFIFHKIKLQMVEIETFNLNENMQ
jgi:hypothetical protein